MEKSVNENVSESLSQNRLIKEYLQSGHSLTQMDALNLFGCFRLASRVYDLRNEGLDIKKETIELANGKRVTRYYL